MLGNQTRFVSDGKITCASLTDCQSLCPKVHRVRINSSREVDETIKCWLWKYYGAITSFSLCISMYISTQWHTQKIFLIRSSVLPGQLLCKPAEISADISSSHPGRYSLKLLLCATSSGLVRSGVSGSRDQVGWLQSHAQWSNLAQFTR